MSKPSRGHVHHADTTVACPSCARRFTHPHHAGVSQQGDFISVQFKSKQTGRWGVLRVPIELVFWGETQRGAWDAEMEQRPRDHKHAIAQMTARIALQRDTAQSG